jgi:hypothetical protein
MAHSSKVRDHIRSNVVGYIALFVAFTIAPAWAGSLKEHGSQTAVKSKSKRGPRGPAGPPGPPGAQGPVGPLTGTADGELAGTYPSPTIGTVAGLDLAESDSPTAGINFGTDTALYRAGADTLRTDDYVRINNFLEITGEGLIVPKKDTAGAPPAGQCDGPGTAAWMVYNTVDNVLYICDGTTWQAH